jgi:hypothetical protein
VASSEGPLSRGYRDPLYRADTVLRSAGIVEEARLQRRDQRPHTTVSDLKEFSGIVFSTKRRIFPRQPDGRSVPEPLVVSIDLDHFVSAKGTSSPNATGERNLR